ncbi:MAG: hypothetical protein BIFFINMI_02911 [Phycisphaerae bacterium]|nr:hypothetical protein [Phycisphaerae bacterium]
MRRLMWPAVSGLAAAAMLLSLGGCYSVTKPEPTPTQIFETINKLQDQAETVTDTAKRDEILDTVNTLRTQLLFDRPEMPPSARLLLPKEIEIVPLTRVGDWDGDGKEDGFEVLVRPLDAFGDATKVVGTFRFELFPYRPAHADRRGLERVARWEQPILTAKENALYWDKYSRNYRFNLVWAKVPAVGEKFVFQVTYIAPWDQVMTTQRVLTRLE